MAAWKNKRGGSVLPSVLIFSIIAALIATAFVSGQYMLARPTLTAPSELQALCNARSGVWKALALLNGQDRPDTLKGINTLDSGFNAGLFKKSGDTNAITVKPFASDSTPDTLEIYSCDSFGTCQVTRSYWGCYEKLGSEGAFGKAEKTVTVTLGGVIPFSADTAYYLEDPTPLQGTIWGKGHNGPDSAAAIRQEDLKNLENRYTSQLSLGADTITPNPPLTVQHNDELEKIPDFVKGPLFIDGSHFDLSWKQKRRVTVLGDVQITGKVSIEGVELVASGEIKCFDDCRLSDVTLFATQRVVMADRAVFSGTAIAATNMLIYGQASIERRSMLIVTGDGKVTAPAVKKNGQKPPRIFSITFTETSTIDATVVALTTELGVKIDRSAAVKGIIWTKGYVALLGKLYGMVRAKALVDAAKAQDGNQQLKADPVLPGSAAIKRIDDANKYYFPFFMGKLSVIQWRE